MMVKLLLIGFAGFIGTLGRYWLSGVVARRYGETFPLGTLAVNLVGCFLVGLLFYLMQERYLVNQNVRTIILIGLLGGFTTFSSLGLQTFTLLQDNEMALAVLNMVASNVLGLLLVWAGYTLAKAL
jgi:CrcB protein